MADSWAPWLAAGSGWVVVFMMWLNHLRETERVTHEKEILLLDNKRLSLEIEKLEREQQQATSAIAIPTTEEPLSFGQHWSPSRLLGLARFRIEENTDDWLELGRWSDDGGTPLPQASRGELHVGPGRDLSCWRQLLEDSLKRSLRGHELVMLAARLQSASDERERALTVLHLSTRLLGSGPREWLKPKTVEEAIEWMLSRAALSTLARRKSQD